MNSNIPTQKGTPQQSSEGTSKETGSPVSPKTKNTEDPEAAALDVFIMGRIAGGPAESKLGTAEAATVINNHISTGMPNATPTQSGQVKRTATPTTAIGSKKRAAAATTTTTSRKKARQSKKEIWQVKRVYGMSRGLGKEGDAPTDVLLEW